MTPGDDYQVLVVDDHSDFADLMGEWIERYDSSYDVEIAYSGEEACEKVNEDTDLVFLDRDMPGTTGDEVLERMREEGYDSRVVMVTGLEPTENIAEMDFDDYLLKTVDEYQVADKLERMKSLDEVDEELRELYSLTQKIVSLQMSSEVDTPSSEAYRDLVERRDRLREDLGEDMESIDFDTAIRLLES
ncbi:MAG: response regulator [Candidatus Nanohaloarchaea archaeon]